MVATYTPKDWALADDITDVTLDHIEQGIKTVTDAINAKRVVVTRGFQELTTNTAVSAGGSSAWYFINSNGVTYIALGAGVAGDTIDIAAQCRHGDYSLCVELRDGASTLIRRFTNVDAPYFVNVKEYALSGVYADLRLYLGVYVTAGNTDTLRGLSGSESYTWLAGSRSRAM